MRYKWGLCVLVLGSSALWADQFSFSFTGSGVNGGGTLTATEQGTTGVYQVTNYISGSRDGKSIVDSGIGNLGVFTGSNNIFGLGTGGFLEFGLQGLNGFDMVGSVLGVQAEMLTSLLPPRTTTTTLSSFSIARITAMPEPSTVLIFLTLGVLVWALGRKLPIRTVRKL